MNVNINVNNKINYVNNQHVSNSKLKKPVWKQKSYNINHNFDILTQIQHPNNIELLCIEDGCPPYCKARHQHQICVSKANQKLNFDQDKDFVCPHRVTKEPTWWYNNYCFR